MKELSFLPGQSKDRNEGKQDDRHRKEDRAAHQLGGRQHRSPDRAPVVGFDPKANREGIAPGSINNCDYLCCEEDGEVVDENRHLSMAPDLPPEDSVFWQISGTSSSGYLIKDADGLYRGELFPMKFELNKEAKTLNGKNINMLSQDVFWGQVFLGQEVGWQIELMA